MPSLAPSFLLDAFTIVMVDILLGGDNAIVIALAVKSLPLKQRKMGIAIGTGAAVVLRITLTFFAAQLLQVSFLKLIGGLVILWIGVKLLADAAEQASHHKHVTSLRHAVWLILVADVTMSVDNILAVAGASKGNLPLLIFGLALSITFVAFASGVLAKLMDRFPVVIWIGAALLGKVGGEMIMGDPTVTGWLHPGKLMDYSFQAFCALGVPGVAWLLAKTSRKKRLRPHV